MRTRLLTTAAVLALSSAGAIAADLPARAPAMAPAPIFTQTAFSWTGFYVGLNAGAVFNSSNRCSGFRPVTAGGAAVVPFPGACGFGRGNDDATFTGGAQLGYNWQFGSLVAGVEADINLLSGKRNTNGTIVAPPGSTAFPAFDGTYNLAGARGYGDYFGTVRARLGYAFDRALIYVTGAVLLTARAATVATPQYSRQTILLVRPARSTRRRAAGATASAGRLVRALNTPLPTTGA